MCDTVVDSLGWETLQDHGMMQRLIMLFKIKHNLVDTHRLVKRQQNARVSEAFRHILHRDSVFIIFHRTIHDWNKLPSSITDMQDTEAFKTALHAMIAVQPLSTA